MSDEPAGPPASDRHRAGRSLRSARAHPVVSAVLAAGCVAAVVLSLLIGMPLFITVGLLVVVAGLSLVLWRHWLSGLEAAGRSEAHNRSETHRGPTEAGRLGLVAVAVSGVVTMVAIQLVPYGRSHSNPPVTGEPQWADDRTRELMVDACFSCHSNQVEYPPYASIAPISWMIQGHVAEGRDAVNYSEFATDPRDADETYEVVREGEMPPPFYTRFGQHPEAKLSEAQLAELLDGIRRTPGLSDD